MNSLAKRNNVAGHMYSQRSVINRTFKRTHKRPRACIVRRTMFYCIFTHMCKSRKNRTLLGATQNSENLGFPRLQNTYILSKTLNSLMGI
ncbi:hypothetical protein TSAR_003655 [Trichomalopsis sarcophagae]|uniref:Uncharacterized protein n=1 Tax=Trichomalopsis sarcophagae TaxID=543379 RepID=A0A232F9K4_9HYME|nr:hypothetical protein TSAR_003655 [Trichomalopsis sarcophagae]